MSITAMKQMLEALDNLSRYVDTCELFLKETHPGKADALRERVTNSIEAITSLRQAIEQAEKQDAWKPNDTAYRPGGLPQDFIVHEVENEGDWSEWVCPDPEQYFMKCCDCGLVHEMQFKVVKYSEGDECDEVDDPDVQGIFRARRVESDGPYTAPQPQQAEKQEPVAWVEPEFWSYLERSNCGTAYRLPDGARQPLYTTPQPQREWVGLTDEEIQTIVNKVASEYQTSDTFARAIEAKLKEKNT